MFLLTRVLVRGGWGGRAPLRVEKALEERGVRDRVGGDHFGVCVVRTGRVVSFDRINDDGADDNEGQELYPVPSPIDGVRVEIYTTGGVASTRCSRGPAPRAGGASCTLAVSGGFPLGRFSCTHHSAVQGCVYDRSTMQQLLAVLALGLGHSTTLTVVARL